MHTYRPDVDGLRAIAVVSVVAFHAFPAAAPGGFAGVDLFFVISGFLISGIILSDLGKGSFTIAEFYRRRVRRIFPALILVLAACLAIGWRVLLPDEFRQLGKHIAAGAGFVSNLALWRESGYFATSAALKPLLHLWSLGVEEQFYLAWPLLLLFFRGRPRQMGWMIATVAAASFALNIFLTAKRPDAAFYLPVSRFWELMAGSALAYGFHYNKAFYASATLRNSAAAAGAILIGISLAVLDEAKAFPGWWALMPTLGAVLLIAAGPQAWINKTVLGHRVVVFTGLISYPLYLWHWPLFSYARIVAGTEPPPSVRIALCAASVLLAWLTYELVEKTIRGKARGRARGKAPLKVVPALAASMVALGGCGVLALRSDLQPQSALNPLAEEISLASSDWAYGADGVRTIPGDSRRIALFIGDSHMQHYWPRIQKIMSERKKPARTVVFDAVGGCAPIPGIERTSQACSAFVDEAFARAASADVDTVVIAASWVGFLHRPDYVRVSDGKAVDPAWALQQLEAALARLRAKGKAVVLVLSSPRGAGLDPKSSVHRDGMTVRISYGAPMTRAALAAVTAPIDSRIRQIAVRVGATVIDPADWFCSATLCPAADPQGRPLYKDESHLRAIVVREVFDAFDRFVYVDNQPLVEAGSAPHVASR
jgi:peptidoglycan/LPS O-acetylase OafA/YrhL